MSQTEVDRLMTQRESGVEQAARVLPLRLRSGVMSLPEDRRSQIEELRLRVGQKPAVLYAGGERPLSVQTVLLQKELQQTLLNASAQSQYAVQEQLRSGYLSLSGGYRLGVCGSAVVQNGCMTGLREISSLALRVPHDIRHPPERLLPYLQESCLLAGAPGSGKTTLLRSCIRALSENRQRVAVVDERLELAGAVHGVPQFDLGPCTDVLSGCPKGEGMLMLLRGMNPQWLAVDEITQPEDLASIRQAGGCGVRLLATIHAGSVEELENRPLCRELFSLGIFRQVLYLDKNRAFHAERIQYAETDRIEPDPGSLRRSRRRTGGDSAAAAGADACADRCAAAYPA